MACVRSECDVEFDKDRVSVIEEELHTQGCSSRFTVVIDIG